jgi:hypothetical protein
MKKLDAIFDDFVSPLKCCMCEDKIKEGYHLHPLTDDAYILFEERFGHPENLTVGECCFGGFCGVEGASTPDDWYKRYIEKKKK